MRSARFAWCAALLLPVGMAAAGELYWDLTERVAIELDVPAGGSGKAVQLAGEPNDWAEGTWHLAANGQSLLKVWRVEHEILLPPTAIVQAFRRAADGSWERVSVPNTEEQASELVDALPTAEFIAAVHHEAQAATPLGAGLLSIPDARFRLVNDFLASSNWASAQATLSELRTSHPDSILFRLLALDLMVLRGDEANLRRQLALDAPLLRAHQDGLIRLAPDYYELILKAMGEARAGRNKFDAAQAIFPADAGFSQHRVDEFLADLSAHDTITPTRAPLLLTKQLIPNFLASQTVAKVRVVESDFALIMGEPDRALAGLRGPTLYGLALSRGCSEFIADAVGMSVMGVTVRGYERALLNGYTDPAALAAAWGEVAPIWEAMEELGRAPCGWEPYAAILDPSLANDAEQPAERTTRARHNQARWALLQAATAARHHQLETGQWPEGAEHLGALLPTGAPNDPFADPPARLKVRATDPDRWEVWSIGPDGEDGGAAIVYDPTNGTVSGGDVVLSVPREREYPFPAANEPRPTTIAALYARYPNGLTPDPFADERTGTVIASEDESGLVVWSVGPDVDWRRWVLTDPAYATLGEVPAGLGVLRSPRGWLGATQTDQPAYDPTNGTISDGNLYLRLR